MPQAIGRLGERCRLSGGPLLLKPGYSHKKGGRIARIPIAVGPGLNENL